MKELKLNNSDRIVTYDDSPEVQKAVFDKLIEYYTKCGCFSGECIYQDDTSLIEAPNVLSDIADKVIKFDEKWVDDDYDEDDDGDLSDE